MNDAEEIQHLRDAALSRVEDTSLRGVAREIGLSPQGLKKFLLGTAPYSATVRRLRKWYLQYGAAQQSRVGMQDARVALTMLTSDLTPGVRRFVTDRLLESLGRGYDLSSRPRPEWVTVLQGTPGARP